MAKVRAGDLLRLLPPSQNVSVYAKYIDKRFEGTVEKVIEDAPSSVLKGEVRYARACGDLIEVLVILK